MSTRNSPLRVLIADHAPEVRQALRLVCEESLGLTNIEEVANSSDLLTLVRTTRPDILLLEWGLPGITPVRLMDTLSTDQSLSIIVMGGRPEMRGAALRARAKGFIYKGDPPDELLKLLRTFVEA